MKRHTLFLSRNSPPCVELQVEKNINYFFIPQTPTSQYHQGLKVLAAHLLFRNPLVCAFPLR